MNPIRQPATIFGTGILGAVAAVPYTPARGNYQGGAPTSPSATLLSNLSDNNPATVAVCNSDGGGYEYFLLDLGSVQTISSVVVKNASVAGGVASLGVGASVTKSLVGIPGNGTGAPAGTTTALVAASGNAAPVTGQNLTFAPAGGTTVTARYLYISYTGSATAGATVTLGGVQTFCSIPLAIIQSGDLDHPFQNKDLYDTPQVSVYAVDNAQHSGKPVYKLKAADVSGAQLAFLLGLIAQALTGPARTAYAITNLLALPYFTVTYLALRQDGGTRLYQFNNVKAEGQKIDFKIEDFAMQDVSLFIYQDANGVLYTITDN